MQTNLALPISLPLPKLHVWSEKDDDGLRLLSSRFSPPQVDFEEASMLDARTRWTRKSKRHLTIDDIPLAELERFYDFNLMQPGDLIFYLYPVFSAFIKDPKIDISDFYLYSLDRLFADILNILSDDEKILLRHTLQVMYERSWFVDISGTSESLSESLHVEIESDLDFNSCPHLLKFLLVYLNPILNC